MQEPRGQVTQPPGRADDTSTRRSLEGLSCSWLQDQFQAQGSWIGRKGPNQSSIHPTGREADECRCCTCLPMNLSSFRVYLKLLMDMRVFSGNLELGISAPSLQAFVSTAFLQVFTGIRLLLPAVQCHKAGQVQQWTAL